ncbi:MAG: hypothetical protein CMO81_04990 [Waddliaceae bacterium]|nr:hypothetical protein [Waddliaceae bacterium]
MDLQPSPSLFTAENVSCATSALFLGTVLLASPQEQVLPFACLTTTISTTKMILDSCCAERVNPTKLSKNCVVITSLTTTSLALLTFNTKFASCAVVGLSLLGASGFCFASCSNDELETTV